MLTLLPFYSYEESTHPYSKPNESVLTETNNDYNNSRHLEEWGIATLSGRWRRLSGKLAPEEVTLLLPHHGGHVSNIGLLLDVVQPDTAVVSAAQGFADEGVLEAVRRRGIRLHCTWREGAISLGADCSAPLPTN